MKCVIAHVARSAHHFVVTVLSNGTEDSLIWPHYFLRPYKCRNITSKLKPQYKYFDIEMQQVTKS